MIYLDNAATSFPKPADCLRRALERYLDLGASPGRGGYDRAIQAEAEVSAVRQRLARFFGAGENAQVCFAANATDALNTLILGLARPGDHVISSRLEHNSVLRPLHHLEQQGIISLDLLPFNGKGFIEPSQVTARLGPATRLVIITHASNVVGTIQPVAEIGAICRLHGVPLIIDAAQTAGCIPIKMREWGVQGLAFTGHKSLLGPTGIGGLVLAPDLHPLPSRFGGTGIDSGNPLQPLLYPSRLEAGTINLFGILGLSESLDFVEGRLDSLFSSEMQLLGQLQSGLQRLSRVWLYGADDAINHLPVLGCTVDGIAAADVGAILDGDFDIAVRTGLLCAPLVHKDFGTFEGGMVRFSLGPFTTENDIDTAVKAMTTIVG
ncbi:MAG: aminotransferase class V-fold PLP-dependent enzyme [Pseudomonadota bacterium]